MSSKSHTKECPLCGRPVLKRRFTYCPRCSRFVRRLHENHLTPQAKHSILDYVRQHGFVCHYTGMSLDLKNLHSPWYCTFDHWIPRDDRKLVLTSFLVNVMKTELSAKEFVYYVVQLFNFKKYGIKIRKKKLKYWQGFFRMVLAPAIQRTIQGARAVKATKECCICGKRFCVDSNDQKYCHICAEVLWRMQVKKFPPSTIKAVLDYIKKYGYVCYYTGMKLNTTDPRSPWYVVLDHWIPGNPKKVVLTSALFNCMKTDLTEKEFWYYIEQIYNYMKKRLKVRKKKPVYWYRLISRAPSKSRSTCLTKFI